MYLHDLPTERKLKKLYKGDLYSKLKSIDGCTRFVFRSGLCPIAYSVADNGKVYGFQLVSQGDDYVITNIIDCSNKGVFPAMILNEDIPRQRYIGVS